jgi:hypothetical protein
VTVVEKPEGGSELKLESIPDENATRKPKPLSASGDGEGGEGGAPARPRNRPKKPRGGSSVPRVPLKA